MNIDTYHLPEIETRGYHTPDLPDYEHLEFSPDDDAKLDRAARWGQSLIERARAGDVQALHDLQHKLHLVRYEVRR